MLIHLSFLFRSPTAHGSFGGVLHPRRTSQHSMLSTSMDHSIPLFHYQRLARSDRWQAITWRRFHIIVESFWRWTVMLLHGCALKMAHWDHQTPPPLPPYGVTLMWKTSIGTVRERNMQNHPTIPVSLSHTATGNSTIKSHNHLIQKRKKKEKKEKVWAISKKLSRWDLNHNLPTQIPKCWPLHYSSWFVTDLYPQFFDNLYPQVIHLRMWSYKQIKGQIF